MDERETTKKGSVKRSNSRESDGGSAGMNDTLHEVNESEAVAELKTVKNRKKYDCSVQHVLRALNSLSTPEEKLAAMCKKYADLFDENRKLQVNSKQLEKQLFVVSKERDQVRTDLAKSVLSRSKLESLCRELQRQNKEIKEESFQKIREEEEKRKEVSAKFQVTLNEITELMKQDNDKTMKLRDDNIDMTEKLKSIYEQYEIREQQMEKMAKQMALESQLYEARIAKMEMETSAEKEMLLREKQQLLVTLTEYQAKFQEYQTIEMTLRNQVALYNNKYEEFEKSLTRSNKMFGGFKEEMESMSNKIVKLESETTAWKLRWEKTQKALLEMAGEKQKSDQEIVVAAKQMATLHKLCRTLQAERAQLIAKLKLSNTSSCCADNLSEVFLENTSKVDDVNGMEQITKQRVELSGKPKSLKNEESEFKVTKRTVSKCIAELKINETDAARNSDSSNECFTTKDISQVEHNSATDGSSNKILIGGVTSMQLNTTAELEELASPAEYSKVSFDNESCVGTSCSSLSNDRDNEVSDQPSDLSSNLENSFDLNDATSSSSKACSASNKNFKSGDVELKQFTFPQADTFSFTYIGNILNELQNNSENDTNTQPPSTGQAFASSTASNSAKPSSVNLEKFVLKKSTHSSKAKISPKKKNKK